MPFPAPLSFLRHRLPERRRIAHLSNFSGLDIDGQESFHNAFYATSSSSSGKATMSQTFPASTQGKSSNYLPPPHYHLLQDEYFYVASGRGIWHLWDGSTTRATVGEEVVVPARLRHRFENDPDSDEPLVVEFWYDEQYAEMEERFFRNITAYVADCVRLGEKPSLVQFCVFAAWNWMPMGLVQLSFLPHWVGLLVNTVLTVVLAGIGRFLMGYEVSYSEYYVEKKAA